MQKSFHLDRRNAVAFGVCAGIADFTGIDATIVRIGVVIATLLGGFPWTIVAYAAAAYFLKPADQAGSLGARERTTSDAPVSRPAASERPDLDHTINGGNSALAREIDGLR